MAATAYLLDTNILLRLAQPGGPYDQVVTTAVERLVAEGATLFYTLQNAAEFWNVRTRPRERNGLGLDITEADRRLLLIERKLLLLPETKAAYSEWRRIIIECRVSGVQVHDARLAAVMYLNHVSHLLTLNPKDFERFEGIAAVRPQDLQQPEP
jgi:predicted nucleic acid-binding protein